MSPQELQGKYAIALQQAEGEDLSDRDKPIYQRQSRMTQHDAVEEAAKALRSLWKPNR